MFPDGTTSTTRSASSRSRQSLAFRLKKSRLRCANLNTPGDGSKSSTRASDFLLVDDYAHHPDRNSRHAQDGEIGRAQARADHVSTAPLFAHQSVAEEFGRAFDDADRVVVTDVYAASEAPIPGISGQTIVDEIVAHGHRGVSYQPRLEWVHCDCRKHDRFRRSRLESGCRKYSRAAVRSLPPTWSSPKN